jgi:hypothetical protein
MRGITLHLRPKSATETAIERDIRLGLTSTQIRDEIIARVGMLASARTPEMQARYDAAVERETGAGRLPRSEIPLERRGPMGPIVVTGPDADRLRTLLAEALDEWESYAGGVSYDQSGRDRIRAIRSEAGLVGARLPKP